jgi:phosphoribosylformimino-5-aminoimidazole carboxamide ribotide isomerase
MRVVPVVDLRRGEVVRGVAGRRSEYRALRSRLAPDATPRRVAEGLVQAFGFQEAYVADLDALAGAQPAWRHYREIAGAGLRLLVDAGLSGSSGVELLDAGAARAGLNGAIVGWIVGLESVAAPEELPALASRLGPRGLFSLDLQNGRPLRRASWPAHEALDVAQLAMLAGFARLIVLDLADVGVAGGTSTLELCSQIRARWPDVELLAGGGVRGECDLDRLERAGCDGALVASALHDGGLTAAVLQRRGAIPAAIGSRRPKSRTTTDKPPRNSDNQ